MTKILFGWSGRIGRATYLAGLLAAFVLGMIVPALVSLVAALLAPNHQGLLVAPTLMLFLWMHLALSAKRLRDIGWSGFWAGVPLVLALTGLANLSQPFDPVTNDLAGTGPGIMILAAAGAAGVMFLLLVTWPSNPSGRGELVALLAMRSKGPSRPGPHSHDLETRAEARKRTMPERTRGSGLPQRPDRTISGPRR